MRFFIGAFLLVWLGGWTMGFLSAGKEVLSGDAEAFLIFWLAGGLVSGRRFCGILSIPHFPAVSSGATDPQQTLFVFGYGDSSVQDGVRLG